MPPFIDVNYGSLQLGATASACTSKHECCVHRIAGLLSLTSNTTPIAAHLWHRHVIGCQAGMSDDGQLQRVHACTPLLLLSYMHFVAEFHWQVLRLDGVNWTAFICRRRSLSGIFHTWLGRKPDWNYRCGCLGNWDRFEWWVCIIVWGAWGGLPSQDVSALHIWLICFAYTHTHTHTSYGLPACLFVCQG